MDISKINIHPRTKDIISAMERNDLEETATLMKMFWKCCIEKHYILREIKKDMIKQGALNALMTGSGPTIFWFWWYAKSSKMFRKNEGKDTQKFF